MNLKERILGLFRVELRTAFEERDMLRREYDSLRALLKIEEAQKMYFQKRESAASQAMYRLHREIRNEGSLNEKMVALCDFAEQVMKIYYKEIGIPQEMDTEQEDPT